MERIQYRVDLKNIIDLSLPAVEVGVAEGYFSAEILSWGIEKLYMVDNWGTIPGVKGDGGFDQGWHDQNMKAALERVHKHWGKFTVLRGLSVEMSKQVPDDSLGLVYLDAGHSFENVKDDLEAWFPKLKKGGIMAGHDYLMPQYGVFEAVRQFIKKHNYTVNTIHENKKEDAGFWFKK
jgi:hypothetical protein